MLVFEKSIEQRLDEFVREHVKEQKRTGLPARVVFLIGYRVDDGADMFIPHVVRCPLPDTADGDQSSSSSDQSPRAEDTALKIGSARRANKVEEQIDAEWICHHGRQLIRMLPGGLDIVGLLLMCDKKTQLSLQPIALKSLRKLVRMSQQVCWMSLRDPESTMCFVSCETPLGATVGYDVRIVENSQRTTSTRIQYQRLNWLTLQSRVALSLPHKLPLTPDLEEDHFRKQFISLIRPLGAEICDRSLCLINGAFRSNDEPLVEKTTKSDRKSKSGRKSGGRGGAVDTSDQSPFDVDLFIKSWPTKRVDVDDDFDPIDLTDDARDIVGTVRFKGTLYCTAVVPQRSTVGDAIDAIKQDFLRSVYARTELHYESMSVLEDEDRDAEAIHQFPRRVLVSSNEGIKYCEYLFDADTIDDAVENFKDVLDMEVDADSVDDTLEQVMTNDLLSQLDVSLPTVTSTSASDDDLKTSATNEQVRYIENLIGHTDERDQRWIFISVGVLVAVLAVILGIILSGGGAATKDETVIKPEP